MNTGRFLALKWSTHRGKASSRGSMGSTVPCGARNGSLSIATPCISLFRTPFASGDCRDQNHICDISPSARSAAMPGLKSDAEPRWTDWSLRSRPIATYVGMGMSVVISRSHPSTPSRLSAPSTSSTASERKDARRIAGRASWLYHQIATASRSISSSNPPRMASSRCSAATPFVFATPKVLESSSGYHM